MNTKAPQMTEGELQDYVMKAARLGGWVATHFRPAKTSRGWRTALQGDAGFPDTVLAHARMGRCVFAELKAERGKTSPEQVLWLETLRAVPGVETYLWKPSDMLEIQRVLLGHMTRPGAQHGYTPK